MGMMDVEDDEDEGEEETEEDLAVRYPKLEQQVASESFRDLVARLERTEVSKGRAVKMSCLFPPSPERFRHQRQGHSLFPLLRLILPDRDARRNRYMIKTTKLASIYLNFLGLKPDHPDSIRLTNFRVPAYNRRSSDDDEPSPVVGNLAETVQELLEDRLVPQGKPLSLKEVNDLLDEIQRTGSRSGSVANVLRDRGGMSRITPVEHKWLVRMIIGDMKLGVGDTAIIGVLGEDAGNAIDRWDNLRGLCYKSATGCSYPRLTLGVPCQPMRTNRCNEPWQVEKAMQGQDFVVERKVDGERLLCHKNGEDIKWWSRNRNNSTELFGPTLDPYIRAHVKAERCILDGEVTGYDTASGRHFRFGRERLIAKQEQALVNAAKLEGHDAQDLNYSENIIYTIFDVIYLDGEGAEEMLRQVAKKEQKIKPGPIVSLTLRQRKVILSRIVKLLPGRLVYPEPLFVTSRDKAERRAAIEKRLQHAVENYWEGLVVKRLDSTYRLSAEAPQCKAWAKIKPEYAKGVGDMDVVLLGTFFGEGAGFGGLRTSFLVGVPESLEHYHQRLEHNSHGSRVRQYFTLARVGAISQAVAIEVGKKLEGHLVTRKVKPRKRGEPIDAPVYIGAWWPRCRDFIPDEWIDNPENSVVIQVKAHEIREGKDMTSNFELLHPSVREIRWDKDVREALDLTELGVLLKEEGGKVKRQGNLAYGNQNTPEKGRSARGKAASKLGGCRVVSPFCIVRAEKGGGGGAAGRVFQGKAFKIASGRVDEERQQLQQLISDHGGIVTGSDTKVVIVPASGEETHDLKTMWKRARGTLFLTPGWLHACIQAGRLVEPPHPDHVVYYPKEETDRYGDSFLRDTTKNALRRVLKRVENVKGPMVSQKDAIMAVERIVHRYNRLEGLVLYLDRFEEVMGSPAVPLPVSHLDYVSLLCRLMGASVTEQLTADVSHVIIDQRDVSRLPAILSRLEELREGVDSRAGQGSRVGRTVTWVVERGWVDEMWQSGEWVREDRFGLASFDESV